LVARVGPQSIEDRFRSEKCEPRMALIICLSLPIEDLVRILQSGKDDRDLVRKDILLYGSLYQLLNHVQSLVPVTGDPQTALLHIEHREEFPGHTTAPQGAESANMLAKWRSPSRSLARPSRTTASLKDLAAGGWVSCTRPRTRVLTDSSH